MENIHIQALTIKYGKNAEKWKTEHDDRKLYSNIYYQLVEAYESVENAPIFVQVAVNEKAEKSRKVLDEIEQRFKENDWI